jgi:hypothetical protein
VQRATRKNLTAPIIYLLAIGVSFLSVQISLIFFILVPVLYIFPSRIDQHWTLRPIHSIDEARGSADGDAGLSGEEASPASRMPPEEQ